jgi:holo-[acyl-carrier protein] synthase
MDIIGHGIDVVETARIQRLVESHGQRFLRRCYTEGELAYAMGRPRRFEHLAGRFAAKEAVFKVLGTGWGRGIGWTDAEVHRLESGAPQVVLHGMCGRVAEQMGIDVWFLSISHVQSVAVASAIGVRAGRLVK